MPDCVGTTKVLSRNGDVAMKSIGIFHQGALGDFLLSLPAFEGFYHLCGPSYMYFWTKSEYAALFYGKAYAGRFFSPDDSRWAAFHMDDLTAAPALPPGVTQLDAFFLFGQENTKRVADLLSRRLRIPVHWIRSFPNEAAQRPVTETLVDQFHALGWPIPNRPVRVMADPAESLLAEDILRNQGIAGGPFAVVHPGSGSLKKVWPLRNWWSLVRWLRNDVCIPVVLTLGPADAPLHPFAETARDELGAAVASSLPLARLVAILDLAALYVGNDSGITHLAAAVGTPSAAVFGPTAPEIWAPRGRNVQVIRRQWNPENVLHWDAKAADAPDEAAAAFVERALAGESTRRSRDRPRNCGKGETAGKWGQPAAGNADS